MPGSPAEKPGVQAGDLLDAVDGKPLRNAPLWKIGRLEGPEGTTLELGLFRGSDEKKMTRRLRARFDPPGPSTKWEKDVGIMRVPGFTPATAASVPRSRRGGRRSISKVILDVRGSVGGEPAAAVPRPRSSSARARWPRCLPQGGGQAVETPGERVWKGRTVILTNDSTGGPAEVFAAALQDRAGATTVGETTAGMAIVQRSVPTRRAASCS